MEIVGVLKLPLVPVNPANKPEAVIAKGFVLVAVAERAPVPAALP
jgi:hypothetical protein